MPQTRGSIRRATAAIRAASGESRFPQTATPAPGGAEAMAHV